MISDNAGMESNSTLSRAFFFLFGLLPNLFPTFVFDRVRLARPLPILCSFLFRLRHSTYFYFFSFETSICIITGFTVSIPTYSFIYSCPVFLSRLFLLFKRLYFNDCLTHFGGSILVVLKRVLYFP